FEGGQTPLHMRIPKLRGFKNRAKLVYEIVNVGDIAARIDAGAFDGAGTAPKKGEAMTVNADVLRAVGLVGDVKKPLKILGGGELSTALFVVADAFTKSATEKIQAAGGSINVLEVPTESRPALGVGEAADEGATAPATAAAAAPKPVRSRAPKAEAAGRKAEAAAEPAAENAGPVEPPERIDRSERVPAVEPVEAAETADSTDEAETPDVATEADAEGPDSVPASAGANPADGADATVAEESPAATDESA
ncbi:MAG: large ribosomal subunit protein uL15, partial [Chloroflexota bacterium]